MLHICRDVLIYVKYFNKNALKLFEYLCHLLNTLTKTPDALTPRPPASAPPHFAKTR